MARRNRDQMSGGNASSRNGQMFNQSTKDRASTATHSSNPSATTTAPTKKFKSPSIPGRVLSLHNLDPSATSDDIRALFLPAKMIGYKRGSDETTGALSSIAFVVFNSYQQAQRVFFALDGKSVMGTAITMNFVNGVRFDGTLMEAEAMDAVGDNAARAVADKRNADGTTDSDNKGSLAASLPSNGYPKDKPTPGIQVASPAHDKEEHTSRRCSMPGAFSQEESFE